MESESLQTLKRIRNSLKDNDDYVNLFDKLDLDTIENEINELYDTIEALEKKCAMFDYWRSNCLKNDKILDIIKAKRVNVHILLDSENLKEYNESIYVCEGINYKLTQEEYDLLKEVLL